MAFDREFAEALIKAMADAGWVATLPAEELPNPLDIAFFGHDTSRRLIIHARRITPQFSPESDHHRPPGELHTQMIFDGDQRGAGVRNYLRFAEGAETLLFGFYPTADSYVVAAYDPERHHEYAYSKSLQVKQQTIDQALRMGIAFHLRESEETVVVFHLSEIAAYLNNAREFHNLTFSVVSEAIEESTSPIVRRVFDTRVDPDQLPLLVAEERKRAVAEVERYIRDHRFSQAIKSVYDRCAICGFQYDYVLDAAHIVPVSEGGTDTYDNGLGLCPNCHRMFDNGLVLVDETGRIYINTHYTEKYDQMGLAGSLETLRSTLRETLWLPRDKKHHPSPENLRRTFEKHRQSR